MSLAFLSKIQSLYSEFLEAAPCAYTYILYKNIYHDGKQVNSALPKIRYCPYGGGYSKKSRRISIKEAAVACLGEESDVPNIQPNHFISGRFRENCPA